MEAVAVYSDADADAQHVRLADVAVRHRAAAADRELPPDRRASSRPPCRPGAEAIHPGYGFLAERAAFARAVEDAGLVFVGPPSASIDALGDKLHARRTARDVGVPAVPGTLEPAPVDRPDQVAAIIAEAEAIGFPLLVKAAAGGGGRGMRRVVSAADLPAALVGGSREAASAFGDGSVYLEREIVPARHIEVQLLGDADRPGRRHRGARLLAPAPPPEARRGGAGARAVGRRPARAPCDGGQGRDRGRPAERRDRRVPPRPGRVVLVPRGQHPAPGRARRDRARVRPRHRPRAVLAGRRAAAVGRRAGRRRPGRRPRRPRDRGPDRGRGSVARLQPDPRPSPPLGHAGRSGRPRRHRDRGRRPGPGRVRQPHRQDPGPCRRPRRRDRPPPPRPRRDRDRRPPDDPAVPPVRGPQPVVRGGRARPPAGSGSTGMDRRRSPGRPGSPCWRPASTPSSAGSRRRSRDGRAATPAGGGSAGRDPARAAGDERPGRRRPTGGPDEPRRRRPERPTRTRTPQVRPTACPADRHVAAPPGR